MRICRPLDLSQQIEPTSVLTLHERREADAGAVSIFHGALEILRQTG